MINVKDFGAKGDGITKDTAAIQSAINAGGVVYFPAGVYLSGTLYLKSNGGLYLENGAVLKNTRFSSGSSISTSLPPTLFNASLRLYAPTFFTISIKSSEERNLGEYT